MLNVFFTVDVEIWCDGWDNIDGKFSRAFEKYIYGPTDRGCFGLECQVETLADHGLTGVFFVEPLFSMRFGSPPLSKIVRLLNDTQQEIQLHLHTEWVDEALTPLLQDSDKKRQHLHQYRLEEQKLLIAKGLSLLHDAGAPQINAFRAGGFAFNDDTLRALASNGIMFDSSYNATYFGLDSGISPGVPVFAPIEYAGVFEYPITVFKDGVGKMRHAQITACSFSELETLLWRALEAGASSFVLLSHNFELLNQTKSRPDKVVVRRFQKLCAFLERNRDCFSVRGFHGLIPQTCTEQPTPLSCPPWKTGGRLLEQMYRRIYQ